MDELSSNEEKRLLERIDPIFDLFLNASHGAKKPAWSGPPLKAKAAEKSKKPLTDEEFERYVLRQCTKLLRSHGDNVTEPYGLKGNVVKCKQNGPRTDPDGNVHKKNNCYLKFDDKGNVRYYCHNKDCRSIGWEFGAIDLGRN